MNNQERFRAYLDKIKPSKALIDQTKQNLRSQAAGIQKGGNTPMKRKPIYAAAGIALAILVGIGVYLALPKAPPLAAMPNIDVSAMAVQPTISDATGMDTSSGLVITCKEDIQAEVLSQYLRLSPDTEFNLQKKGSGSYLLTTEAEFNENQIVNLALVNPNGTVLKSWAFQTKAVLRVLSTLPGHKSDYVPTNSGIEIRLSTTAVTLADFEAAFRMEPAVEGVMEKYGETFTFIPTESLPVSTVFTITVDGSLVMEDGTQMGEDQTFTFRTAAADGDEARERFVLTNAAPTVETFLPTDTPVIALNANKEEFSKLELTTVVYRYPSFAEYEKAVAGEAARLNTPFGSNDRPVFSTEGLSEHMRFESTLVYPEGSWWSNGYVLLPEPLEPGWYLAVVSGTSPYTGKTMESHKLLQISPLALYYSQLDNEALIWLNNAESVKAVAGATMRVEDGGAKVEGKTDAEGLLRLDTKSLETGDENQRYALLSINDGTNSFADILRKTPEYELTPQDLYYTYLYTDRPYYMATDTVKAWGFIQPRQAGTEMPKQLYVTLDGLYHAPVTLKADGSFTAEISFEQLGGRGGSWAQLLLVDSKEPAPAYAYRGISIADYVKPIYVFNIEPTKPVYPEPLSGTIEVAGTVHFFDGTPAAGVALELEYSPDQYNNQAKFIKATTDEQGRVSFQLQVTQGPSVWRPHFMNIFVRSAQSENFYYRDYLAPPLLFRDVMLESKCETNGDKTTVTFQMSRIDASGITKPEEVYDNDALRGQPYSSPIAAVLKKVYYTKESTGSYYDYVQKRTVTLYDYRRHDDAVTSYTVTPGPDGTVKLENLPASDAEASYYLEITYKDSKGRNTEETLWLGWDYYYNYYGTKNYSLQKTGVPENNWLALNSFTENEAVLLELLENGRPKAEGKILFVTNQTDLKQVRVVEGGKIAMAYDAGNIPNIVVSGAYLDPEGRIYPIAASLLQFNPESRALSLQITPDKESYKHGEQANLEVTVTERATGKPAARAAVSVSIVDEAIFAMGEDQANILSSLYESRFYRSPEAFVSYVQHNFLGMGGGEKGGGGDGGIRATFKDTALFIDLTTDSNGKAKVSYTLPDNLTKWRITAQAVTPELMAGTNTANIVTAGTFFVQPVMPTIALTDEDVVLSLRSYGTGVNTTSPVEYTATIAGGAGQTQTVTASSTAGSLTHLKFKPLSPGSYTITLEATSGELYDGIEQPLRVVKSGVEADLVINLAFNEISKIEVTRFPVQLGFYDESYGLVAQLLQSMRYGMGRRTDQRIAARFAQEYVARLSGEAAPPVTDDLLDVLSNWGSAQLLPYGQSDIEFSARVAATVPEYFFGNEAAGYFNSILSNAEASAVEVSSAMLGMAAHKRPVLLQIQQLLAQPEGLSLSDKLRLTAALAAIGDYDGAAKQFDDLVRPHLVTGADTQGFPTAYMQVEENADMEQNLYLTGYASMIASYIGAPEAEALARCLVITRSERDLYLLEQVVYVKHARPASGEKASFSYQTEAGLNTVELSKLGMVFLNFSKPQLEQANFKLESGQVGVKAYYKGSAADAMDRDNQTFTMTKTIRNVNGSSQFKVGDMVEIRLEYTMPSGLEKLGVVVNDCLPTGMRYSTISQQSENDYYINRLEGQRISFIPAYEEVQNRTVTYYARCVAPGSYVQDSAFVSLIDGMQWGMSERGQVEIGE